MNIGQGVFNGYDNNITDRNVHYDNANQVKQSSAAGTQSELAGLKEGSVFKGEILDIAGDKVTIALDNNATMPARLQGDVSLTVGDILLFSVKENNQNQVLIKPMFDSLYSAQTQTLEKVLDSAGLSPTEKNFTVAKELMEAGMPVDKGSLVKVLSQSMKFEGVPTQTLVALNKMNIPVTEENIAQYERYQNYSHQLTGDIADTADSMANFAKAFPEGTSGETLTAVAKEIMDIIMPENDSASMVASESEAVNQNAENPAVMENVVLEENAAEAKSLVEAENKSSEEAVIKEQLPDSEKAAAAKDSAPAEDGKQAATIDKSEIADKADITRTVANESAGSESTVVSKEFMQSVESTLQKAGVPEEQLKNIVKENSTPEELLKQMTQALNNVSGNESAVRTIIESPEYKKLVSDVVKNNWAMNPKSMKDPKEIDELYDKILKQSKAFEDAINSKGGDAKEFNQSSQNMKQNMQFMEDINQQMIYAQMPLKLSNQNANSELYVYADKRKLAEKKDGISVMLHLDMDHLGTTDIKVTLTGSNVNARFYLNDQESVDIVVNNMNELAKQLADRGFSLTNEVVKREPQKSINKVVDEIIDENAEKSIKRYTFDART